MELQYLIEYTLDPQALRRGRPTFRPVGVWVKARYKPPRADFIDDTYREAAMERIKSFPIEGRDADDFLDVYRDRFSSYSGMCDGPTTTDDYYSVDDCLATLMQEIRAAQ